MAATFAQVGSIAGTRILVVDDEPEIRAGLARHLEYRGAVVRTAASVAEAIVALKESPEVIVLDVQLPDGTGIEIAEAALELRPRPRMIAMSGTATASEAFRLARLNVWRYLAKPCKLSDLDVALAQATPVPDDLAALGARCVGQIGLVEARDLLRESMVNQAVELAGGDKTRAADLLGVTRQAVQRVLREE